MSSQPGSIIITGARGGMTAITVSSYHARHPEHQIVCLVRDPTKISGDDLPAPSDQVQYVACELGELASVRKATQDIIKQIEAGNLPKIECLVQSAAIQVTSPDQPRITKDGYEETVAVNHLAHYVLTLELLPYMQPNGRIVIVGSDAHRPGYKFFKIGPKYDKVERLVKVEPGSEPSGEALDRGRGRYATSKLLQMMIGHELARRLKASQSNVHVVLCHPGSMGRTGLFRDRPWLERTLGDFALTKPWLTNSLMSGAMASRKEDSAATLLKIIEEPGMALKEPIDERGEVVREGGAPYYHPWGEQTYTLGEANDTGKCEELWEDTAKLLGYDKAKALM